MGTKLDLREDPATIDKLRDRWVSQSGKRYVMSSSVPSVACPPYSIPRALQCAKTLEPWNTLNVQLLPRRVWKQFSMKQFGLFVSVIIVSIRDPSQLLVVNPLPHSKKGHKGKCIIAWSRGDWTLNLIGMDLFSLIILRQFMFQLKLVYKFCTYEVSIEFGSMLLLGCFFWLNGCASCSLICRTGITADSNIALE